MPTLNPQSIHLSEAKKWKATKHKTITKRCDTEMTEQVNLATIQLNGEKQNFLLSKKDFKTGSRGYHAQGKMQVGDKNYQINILCVEIGSKPKEKQK